MLGFELYQIGVMALGMFLGGLAKGISGVALPLTATAIALSVVDVPTAVAMVALSLVVTNVYQAFSIGDVFTPVRRFWPMIISFVLGLYFGAKLINILDPSDLLAIVGAGALLFAASQVWQPKNMTIGPGLERVLSPIIGVVGGTLGGLTSMWGPPLIVYLILLRLKKDVFVQTITVLYLFGAVPLVLFYYMNGVLDGNLLYLSAAACVPALVGTYIGGKVRGYINEVLFRRVLLVVLVVIGLNLIRRGLF